MHTNTTWVIRARQFGYNDECYYVAGSNIAALYDDPAEARQQYRQLEIDAARNFPLAETDVFFDADADRLRELDAFVHNRCGVHILEGDEVIDGELPSALNDDDTFEFIQRAGLQAYELVELPADRRGYVLWLAKTQAYHAVLDECFGALAWSVSPDDLLPYLEYLPYEYENNTITLSGSLEQLSEQPLLLEQLLKAHPAARHDAKRQQLRFKGTDADTLAALIAINPLLKEPVFRIEAMDIADIQALDRQIARKYGWYEDEDLED